MTQPSAIRSVNWHLISACNYSCRFCFAQNLGEKPVTYAEGCRVLTRLADAGMEKINFAGGEPLLHPHLFDYCHFAKDLGMTVSITTNGSQLNADMIQNQRENIDWIALSVDSASEQTEKKLGRGNGNHVGHCIAISDAIKEQGIKLKINTTVTALTWKEDMTDFIQRTYPDRWKVLQMLHIQGENDDSVNELSITKEQFTLFQLRHSEIHLNNRIRPVFEPVEMIEGSYFMITPGGNVKTDNGRKIQKFPLESVLVKGIVEYINEERYLGRGGMYEW